MALEYEVANYFFIVRMLNIGPVSKEMILNFVAERTLGLPAVVPTMPGRARPKRPGGMAWAMLAVRLGLLARDRGPSGRSTIVSVPG